VVNGDDYILIDNAFNSEGSASYAVTPATPAAEPTEMIALVPEPSSLVLMIVGAAGLLGRSRQRRVESK
jgi:hypothetical protein